MAHTLGSTSTRTSASTSPITTGTFTLDALDTVLCLLLKINGGTDRAGGAPTLSSLTYTQANSTQKAVTSPEASCELWYILNPCKFIQPGAYATTIPNTGSLTIFYTFITGRAAAGGSSALDGANGGNGTSTNPTAGAVACSTAGDFGVAVCCSGLTDFDPATPSHTGFGTGTGTPLGTFDDGAHGGGQQYGLIAAATSETMMWTVGSDDWGCVAAFFKEIPPNQFQNYMGIKVANGGFVTEKIR